jgi:hypothetical protein
LGRGEGGILGFDFVQRCGDLSPGDGLARLNRFWSSIDPADMRGLIPHLKTSPDCAEARRWMSMVGLKYGPVMLLSYYPLVVVFGRPVGRHRAFEQSDFL